MNRNSKKGFTIVELIIVIAVIAVLAAVLIPTFSNLIQKANEAKDTALVSNLNKAVAMDTTSHDTMYDVLKVAEDVAGINVAKINAAANSNEILWDSVNKCFVYSVNGTIKYIPDTKSKDVAGDYDYWKISSNEKDITDGKYSIYWNGANLTDTVKVKTGFDAGNAEIANIEYIGVEKAKVANPSVTIRTNGGKLVVNAANDSVAHYNIANAVEIKAVYTQSYHEHGEVVGDIVITKGRIELAATAQVGTVLVASENKGDVKVDVVSGAQVGTVAPTTDAAQEDVKASTTIPAESKMETKVETNSDFAGGLGTERSPYLVATTEQFVKISNYAGASFKQIADITVNGRLSSFSGKFDGNGYKFSTSEEGVVGTQLFGVIYGTEGSSVEFRNITLVENKDRPIVMMYGPDNARLPSKVLYESIAIVCGDTSVIDVNNSNFGFLSVACYWNTSGHDVDVEVNGFTNEVSVSNSGTCTAVIFGQGIDNDENGSDFWGNANINVSFKNCVNNGDIGGTTNVGVFTANYGSHLNSNRIKVENCTNTGTIISQLKNGNVGAFANGGTCNEMYQNKIGGTYSTSTFFDSHKYKVNFDAGKFYVDAENTENYKFNVVLNIQATYVRPDLENPGNGWKYVFEAAINSIGQDVTDKSIEFKAADVKTAVEKEYITAEEAAKLNYEVHAYKDLALSLVTKEVEGKKVVYVIFEDGENYYIDSSVSVLLYVYTEKGVCLGVDTIK